MNQDTLTGKLNNYYSDYDVKNFRESIGDVRETITDLEISNFVEYLYGTTAEENDAYFTGYNEGYNAGCIYGVAGMTCAFLAVATLVSIFGYKNQVKSKE